MAETLAPKQAPSASRARLAPAAQSVPERASPSVLSVIQRRMGNRAVASYVQAKLRLGAPGDRYEQEADQVADAVAHPAFARQPAHAVESAAPAQSPVLQRCSCGGSCASCSAHKDELQKLSVQRRAISAVPLGSVQRESTDSCKVADEPKDPEEAKEEAEEKDATEEAPVKEVDQDDDDDATVQKKGRADGAVSASDVESRIDASRGRGSPLPHDTRAHMESRFGYDFSGVRVHTDVSSHHLNRDLNSHAFTTGRDIYFAPGQFQPGTRSGDHLLAHELTHVVQQSGGGGMVRQSAAPGTVSRAGPERKSYYGTTVSGAFVHHILENILRGVNTNLVTEAAIPGANRFGARLNKVGVADLYKSTPTNTVTGVKGIRDVATPADVIAMDAPGTNRMRTQPSVTSSPTRTGPPGTTKGWAGDFPAAISLGEIKPLNTGLIGAGFAQLDHYEQGYQAFVARVHQISNSTRATIGIGPRLALVIPERLNFDHWSTQHSIPSPDTTFKGRRIWIAALGNGVFVYFDLDAGLAGSAPPKFVEHITKLRTIRQHLNEKHPKTEKLVNGKFLPGGPRIANAARPASANGARLVQRSTKDRPPNYWSERARDWEKERSSWGKDFRSDLKTQFRSFRDKLRIEKKLSWKGRSTAPASEKAEVKDYSSLMFWSGLPGKFLGKLRFLLGSVWDRLVGVFEKMKEKMAGIRDKVKGVSETGVLAVGWVKTLIKVLVKVAKFAVARFITESFNFFVDCFHSGIDKVMVKLEGEISEKFAEELCEVRKFYDKAKETLETEWGESLKKLQELLELIQDIKHWVDIAYAAEALIRLGVEVISCLTPPALGCLWGLVAQVGLEVALDLIMGTQWFNDNIVNPTIGKLVRNYASPFYQSLINRALGDDLKEYHCHLADKPFPDLDIAVTDGITGAELVAHRDEWEARNKDAMVKDLQKVFQKGNKKPTPEELQKLADEISKSPLKREEIRKLLEAARKPATGKIELENAQANVANGEAPDGPVKERKIDYEKATKANARLQKSLHWEVMTFYKSPGVQADSPEFADAVYDMQVALRITADGILGEETLLAFYAANKLKPDAAFEEATKVKAAKKEAREKAAAEKAAKAAKANAAKEAKSDTGKTSDNKGADSITAIPIDAPAPGMRLVTPDYLVSSPGYSGIPYGQVEPAKATYTKGEAINITVLFWLEHQWVWFPNISADFDGSGSMNGYVLLSVKVHDAHYFVLSDSATTVYQYSRPGGGTHGLYLDMNALP